MKMSRETRKKLKQEKERLLLKMINYPENSEEFQELLKIIKMYDDVLSNKNSIDLTQLSAWGLGIIQILLIMNFERLSIFTGKAIGFVVKGRV